MNTPSRPHSSFFRAPRIGAALFAVSIAPLVHASLFVYEGFNGYTTGALVGQQPNANTVGLNTSIGYYDGTLNRTAGYTIQSSGLTFNSLATSGGALAFSAGTYVIGADITKTAVTGTLWSSYLINFSNVNSASGNGALVRIGDTPDDSSGAHFNSWADSRNGTSTKAAVGYGSTGSDGNASLALNTTYIVISSYTNVGTALSASIQGVATLWVMTESQFGAFIASGGTESALQTASVTATATQTTTSGNYTFNSNSSFGIVAVGDDGVIDELRYGSTLADVTPIPEPATLSAWLGAAGGLAALLLRRQRKAGASDRS